MAKQLTELETLEISLVKRGANKRRYALTKSEDLQMQDLTAAILATPGVTAPAVAKIIKADLSKEAQAVVGDALKMLDAVKDEMSKDLLKAIGEALGVGSAKADEFEEGEESEGTREADEADKATEFEEGEESEGTREADEETEKGYKRDATMADDDKPKANPDDEETEKSITKSDDPRLVAMFKENADLKATIAKAANEARTKELIAKAEKEYAGVPGANPAKVGTILKRLEDFNGDLAKEVEGIFRASNALAKNAGVFAELGSSQPGISKSQGTGAVDTLAKQRVVKTGESFAKAYEAVLMENPSLYNELIADAPPVEG